MYKYIIISLIFVFGSFSTVFAQENECQHDPYPYDGQNITVSCTDQSCNVGPCIKNGSSAEESTVDLTIPQDIPVQENQVVEQTIITQEPRVPECQHDPYPSDAQNITVSCDDSSCNVGPCIKNGSSAEKSTIDLTTTPDPVVQENQIVEQLLITEEQEVPEEEKHKTTWFSRVFDFLFGWLKG